jgi:oxygen-independent coproporphyrinogen-3 oxidase
LRARDVADRFGIDVAEHFAAEFTKLQAPGGLVDAGLVQMSGADIDATPMGRPFIRNVAMVFDARTGAPRGEQVFSRTV